MMAEAWLSIVCHAEPSPNKYVVFLRKWSLLGGLVSPQLLLGVIYVVVLFCAKSYHTKKLRGRNAHEKAARYR
jgi:hypothetical protein